MISIWARQAGKDVYVEKPVSHNAWEGRQIVNAARKYKHHRANRHPEPVESGTLWEAVAWIRAGNLGDIQLVRGLCYKPRQSIGKVEARRPFLHDQLRPVVRTVANDAADAPETALRLALGVFHGQWRPGQPGIHQMDIARWVLGEEQLSPKVFSVGGRFGYVDDANTPNTQVVPRIRQGTADL